jgi:hypothetical protein
MEYYQQTTSLEDFSSRLINLDFQYFRNTFVKNLSCSTTSKDYESEEFTKIIIGLRCLGPTNA